MKRWYLKGLAVVCALTVLTAICSVLFLVFFLNTRHRWVPALAVPPKKKVVEQPVAIPLPPYCQPFGPANAPYRVQLVGLNGWNGEQIKRFTGAEAWLPPSYYDTRTGRLIGFAWWYGVSSYRQNMGGDYYIALSAKRTDRVLVVIRRKPIAGVHNIGIMDPAWVKEVVEDDKKNNERQLVTMRVIKLLRINLHEFDVVTMHLGSCVEPKRRCERSGLYGSETVLKPFFWKGRRQHGGKKRMEKFCPVGGTLLCGDGGGVIRQPTPRSAVILLFRRWPREQHLVTRS